MGASSPAWAATSQLLAYSADPRQNYFLGAVLEPAGVTPGQIVPVGLTEAILQLVAAGEGVAVLADWSIGGREDVARLRLGAEGIRRRWYALHRAESNGSSLVPDFCEAMQSVDPHVGG